jgi:predicted transcriptional regulator
MVATKIEIKIEGAGKDSFFEAVDLLIGNQESKAMAVLKHMIRQCDIDRQRWYNTKGYRDEIRQRVNVSEPTLNKYIRRMSEAGLLLKLPEFGRGVYKINPLYIKLTHKS